MGHVPYELVSEHVQNHHRMNLSARRWLRISLAIGATVAALFGAERWLESTLRRKSVEALADFCGPRSRVTIGSVELHVISGDLRWSRIRIEQGQDSTFSEGDDHTFHLTGTTDEVAIQGLSMLRLLFAHTLRLRSLRVVAPHLALFLRADTLQRTDQEETSSGIEALRMAEVHVSDGVLQVFCEGHSGALSAIEAFDAEATDLSTGPVKSLSNTIRLGSLTGEVSWIKASLSPLYDLDIACVSLAHDGEVLLFSDAAIKPLKGPLEYQTVAHFESDLIAAHLDTFALEGLDLNALLGEQELRASRVLAAGVTFEIHRDKTMPDKPKAYMPLPLKVLQRLPFDVCVDTVRMDRWTVQYHEKGDLSPDYGDLLFTDVSGTLAGLCTKDTSATSEVVLLAHARAYGQAAVDAELRSRMGDHNDRFTLNATIGAMPLDVFNRMTTDLTQMKAVKGRIAGLHYSLTASDDRATGRVDMEYLGLEISALKHDGSGDKNKLKSTVLNELVRSENLRSNGNFRHGDFAFDREKDRSIFKYVWTGLREGVLAGMLPGALDDLRKSSQDLKSN